MNQRRAASCEVPEKSLRLNDSDLSKDGYLNVENSYLNVLENHVCHHTTPEVVV